MSYKFRSNENFFIRLPFNNSFQQIAIVEGDALVKQSFKDDCDINLILAKYSSTGQMPMLNNRSAVYADVSEVPDYSTALQIVNEAERAFMALPGNVRARFDNDPAKLINFVQDENNREEAVQLGFISPSEGKQVDIPPAQPEEGAKASKEAAAGG